MTFSLIETLRWSAHGGFLRLDNHLTRLAISAQDLGFEFNIDTAIERLDDAVEKAFSSQHSETIDTLRMRLQLEKNGSIETLAVPFSVDPAMTVYRLAIAETRLDSADPLIRYKTTQREKYEMARAEFPRETVDEVILLNEDGHVCEGTITNLFLRMSQDGPLLTPALSCGLLPGVLRSELIQNEVALEAELSRDDLHAAREIYVGNSLRGMIMAKMVSV